MNALLLYVSVPLSFVAVSWYVVVILLGSGRLVVFLCLCVCMLDVCEEMHLSV